MTPTHRSKTVPGVAYGEIINPSDPYTICVDDWPAACCAVLLLGGGMYSIESDTRNMPLFMFGGFEEWWSSEFPETSFESVMTSEKERIAVALDSVVLGRRADFEAARSCIPDDKVEEFLAKWNDSHRSSLNDIGRAAREYAEALRNYEPIPAPGKHETAGGEE